MKPVATRRSEVEQKFAYATARRHDLSNQVFEAQAANREPAFLSQTAADVIATARECFDYLGQDIHRVLRRSRSRDPGHEINDTHFMGVVTKEVAGAPGYLVAADGGQVALEV